MGLFAALAKHGLALLIGFVLGLIAIAIVEPITVNGRVLLVLTVIVLTTIVVEIARIPLRWLRSKAGKKPDS